MQPFEALRSETQIEAGRFGSFETNWAGTECTAIACIMCSCVPASLIS